MNKNQLNTFSYKKNKNKLKNTLNLYKTNKEKS